MKGQSLEEMVKNAIRNMIISDVHIPYQDNRAVNIMMKYAANYKPDRIYINGDLIDFYSISDFDKCPDRNKGIPQEIDEAKAFLNKLREQHKKAEIYFLEGNHENRLQKYVWRHPELNGLGALDIKNMLNLDRVGIKLVRTDRDYWGKESGHIKSGDLIIMHGDSRINGCKGGQYAAKNTSVNISSSVAMGHTHRLSEYNTSNNYIDIKGIETGCLCQIPKMANWQNGFVTYETLKGKNHNYRLHKIDRTLIEDRKVFK